MNHDNFIDTVYKKLNLDYSKGILDVGDDFKEIFGVLDKCDFFMDFTDTVVEAEGLKQARIHMKAPAENKPTFEKYSEVIVHTAKDLYAKRDGYTICTLVCDVLAPEAQAV